VSLNKPDFNQAINGVFAVKNHGAPVKNHGGCGEKSPCFWGRHDCNLELLKTLKK